MKKTSKLLSYILRHNPSEIDITLDKGGWADVSILLNKINISFEDLCEIVSTCDKKRFKFNEDKTKIRANQGHSIDVDLGYEPIKPPEILYHGTSFKSLDSILETGINKKNRHHVHLSKNVDTAMSVGKRHGKPFIFKVKAKQMYNDGFEFFVSDNGVWLTDFIPVKYLEYEI